MLAGALAAVMMQAVAPPAGPASALPSPTSEAEPSVVTNPDWIRRPSGEDFARYYPEKAIRHEVTGRAVLSCGVTAEGLLADCKVVEDFPTGFGFGEAVLKMAPLFRMRPMTKDGAPVAGGTVRIPMRFLLPGGAGPDALSVTLGCYGQTAAASQAKPADLELISAYTFFATQVAFREREARATPQTFEANLADARRGATNAGPKGGPGTPGLSQCVEAFRKASTSTELR